MEPFPRKRQGKHLQAFNTSLANAVAPKEAAFAALAGEQEEAPRESRQRTDEWASLGANRIGLEANACHGRVVEPCPRKKQGKRLRALKASLAKEVARKKAAAVALAGAQEEAPRGSRQRTDQWASLGADRIGLEADACRMQRQRAPPEVPRHAHAGRGGNLVIVNMGEKRSRHDFGLVAAAPLLAPSPRWRERAHRRSLAPGWSRGVGADGLDAPWLASIVEYEGTTLSPSQAAELLREGAPAAARAHRAARNATPTPALCPSPADPRWRRAGHSHSHWKRRVETQYGTRPDATLTAQLAAVDGATIRAQAVLAHTRRAAGDAERLARLGLGCLSNAASAAVATTEVVCDGASMFLVPRRDLRAGEALTHVYNWVALASDDARRAARAQPGA